MDKGPDGEPCRGTWEFLNELRPGNTWMREVMREQLGLGELPIGDIKIDTKSRDDIPKLLMGLQYIYTHPDLRAEVFGILQEVIPLRASGDKASAVLGRRGMDQWKILVLGVLRLGLNADYDRLQEHANQHQTLRQMLGHVDTWHDKHVYEVQTLKDNLRLFTQELLDRINAAVVRAGHALLKKSLADGLKGRCDSFVVETNVHFPTDINLLYDAVRKTLGCCTDLSGQYALCGWRQSAYQLRQFKQAYRALQKLKHSTSKDDSVREAKQALVRAGHQGYVEQAEAYLVRARQTRAEVLASANCPLGAAVVAELDGYVAHAQRQIDQIRRRVLLGETIPHGEKVFSLFEPHTEWISKGKAGVPVELGLRVCILEDRLGFILHHHVMAKETDDQVAVSMVDDAQKRFPALCAVSFDKGFHSPANRQALETRLELVALPKKGKLSVADRAREQAPAFVEARRQHSAVESAINGLEHGGLDICPDHGLPGFKRYVALAVLARNIHRLGAVLRQQHHARAKTPVPEPQRLAA